MTGILSARARRLGDALASWPRRRIRLDELWQVLDEVELATRTDSRRRRILAGLIAELAAAGHVELPAARSYDHSEEPSLPRFLGLCREVAAPEAPRRAPVWHPSLSWVPTFRSWPDYEDRTTTFRDWTPGIMTGLVQTEDYARALVATEPGLDAAARESRVRGRMERQRRFRERQPAVMTTLLVDVMSLLRQVGSAEVMAVQLRHLLDIAALPTVTLQVMRAVEHPANNSGIMIADSAAWCEHAAAGYVFTDPETVRRLALRFDTLRAESYRASESIALIGRLADIWATGVNLLTATLVGETASK